MYAYENKSPLVKVTVGIVLFNHSQEVIEKAILAIASSSKYLPTNTLIDVLLWNNGERSFIIPDAQIPILLERSKSSGNIGFGSAHNKLMKAAFERGSKYYCALNADGMVHPKCIQELLKTSIKFSDNALVEAKQCPVEHPKIYDPLTFDTPWVSGACFLYPEKIYEFMGGFDENFFLYCEDVDLSWRVKKAGFLLKFTPTALFYHETQNRPANPYIQNIMYLSGRYLAHKWGAHQFKTMTENHLLNVGPYTSIGNLPALSRDTVISTTVDDSICDFNNLFYFSAPRWVI